MAQNTKIEWCDHTVNFWWGCTKVHEGCDNCYAENLSHRWGNDVWGNDKPRKIIKSTFDDLAKYQRLAAKEGVMKRVFINSMSDIFEKPMPLINDDGESLVIKVFGEEVPHTTAHLRAHFFDMISANAYPNLFFLLLTKRPSNINKYIPESWKDNPPANVMFGTSPVNQATANTLIPQLLQVKGRKFLSIEPQLDALSLDQWIGSNKNRAMRHSLNTGHETGWLGTRFATCLECDIDLDPRRIDWVIQGGESGSKKRPFDIQWAADIRKECLKAVVPYFFKQIDKVLPIPTDLMIRQFPPF